MQAVIHSLESFVLAMAVAAFAHFGVALKDAPRSQAAPPVHQVAYTRAPPPQSIRRAPAPLAKTVSHA